MSESKCQANIIIDCDYQNYMNEDELKKLCNQLNRCYSLNRHSDAPVNLYFTSIKGKLQNFMKSLHPGYARWDVFLSEKHWSEIFSSKIIYLTGDSSNILPDCKEIQDSNDIFVIGGLIDHNRHKGLSLKRAIEEYKVQHSRLPLDLHIKLTQSRILSIPHVFEIMLNAVNKSMDDWSMIFKKVIPIRKQQLQIITDLEDSNKNEISMELKELTEARLVTLG
ncbi:tRNA (Guanine-1)-methyltransferase-like protein 2 [Sarcoptes scabiei]|uniref:tRNA (guanine(9)-N(1))-methyltransferase n=1 Tax=Sarcoptes scabiei TaxID=52283 RepID=A0A132AHL0_SARSC|nr:tRNA (Guanine-1)-methyltransferase-like protein 2 [Sarcoptes scabiei]